MTQWIGLTGGIGSGKTAVSDLFIKLNVPVIDADEISRSLTAVDGLALPFLREQWGEALFLSDGSLNRQFLREKVFNEQDEKKKLEQILHPLILSEIKQRQQQEAAPYGIVSVPLLVELPEFLALVNQVLVVDCDERIQVARVQARNGLSEPEIKAIMKQQATRQERLQHADQVIVNESDLESLIEQVQRLHCQYQAQCSAK